MQCAVQSYEACVIKRTTVSANTVSTLLRNFLVKTKLKHPEIKIAMNHWTANPDTHFLTSLRYQACEGG